MCVCVCKEVKCEQRESKGRSDLNGECGSKTVCGGMEGSVINGGVGESKVWLRVVGVCVCICLW